MSERISYQYNKITRNTTGRVKGARRTVAWCASMSTYRTREPTRQTQQRQHAVVRVAGRRPHRCVAQTHNTNTMMSSKAHKQPHTRHETTRHLQQTNKKNRDALTANKHKKEQRRVHSRQYRCAWWRPPAQNMARRALPLMISDTAVRVPPQMRRTCSANLRAGE